MYNKSAARKSECLAFSSYEKCSPLSVEMGKVTVSCPCKMPIVTKPLHILNFVARERLAIGLDGSNSAHLAVIGKPQQGVWLIYGKRRFLPTPQKHKGVSN